MVANVTLDQEFPSVLGVLREKRIFLFLQILEM